MAGQRPLLERAAAGDREAFARLYEDQVEGVYRYLLAWTGDRAEAAELTGQVFRGALAWLPATVGGEGEAGAWLIAMARDAVAQRRGSGWIAGPAGPDGAGGPATDAVAAVARLGDAEREVVVLRLLLGHSLAHTSHLSGYSRRAVLQLQLAACLAVWELTGGARTGPAPANRTASSAEEFERRLGRWEIDLTGSDPALADALAAAGSLRRAIPGYVVAPDDELVQRLRRELLAEMAGDNREHLPPGSAAVADPARPAPGSGAVDSPEHLAPGSGAVDSRGHPAPGSATFPLRGPQQRGVGFEDARDQERGGEGTGALGSGALGSGALGSGALGPGGAGAAGAPRPEPSAAGGSGEGRAEAGEEAAQARSARRHWVATAIAAAGIVVVLALQAFGRSGPPSACGGRPCPAPTTVAAAAGGGGLGPPLTTVLRSTTTTSTLRGQAATTTAQSSAATAPSTTRPATTTPPTTRAPRPPTTTRRPTTTAPPTTAAATTTTAAPAPT
jgi:DNA-directed RNA polymerase specialized sigma24 family protein